MNMKILPEIIDEKAEYGECEKGCLIEFKTKVNWMYYYEVQSEQTERNDLEFFCRRISQSQKFIALYWYSIVNMWPFQPLDINWYIDIKF